jgi:hypothetical protein
MTKKDNLNEDAAHGVDPEGAIKETLENEEKADGGDETSDS